MATTNLAQAAAPFTWTREYLVKVLGTGTNPVITDPIILNAFHTIDRLDFTPPEQHTLAYQDKYIDIGYQEQMTNPVSIAKQIQALEPKVGGKYLHLGTGTGYVAVLLGFIAGKEGHVFSLERIQWLWEQARRNLYKYREQPMNVTILYRDGLLGLADKAPYDGILVSFAISEEAEKQLLSQLNVGGKLVYPTPDYNLHIVEKQTDGSGLTEIQPGFVFKPGQKGTI